MVKPGYKQTTLGVVPEEWEVCAWEDAGSCFSSGATPYRAISRYYEGDIKWVSSGELNYNIITETIEHISEEAQKNTNLTIHPANTFLMAITGLEAAGTRGSCAILGVPATTNQSCMAVYGTEKLDVKYLFYYYSSNGDDLAFKYCQGTKQQSYTASIVKKLPIILPPIAEQKEIANALSEADQLIGSIEKQIIKKKAIKQGAMQELLTGKKRLDGFNEKWVVCKISEIGKVITGTTPSRTVAEYWNGKHSWVSAQDFQTKYITRTAETVTDLGKSVCRFVPPGTVLVTCIASIGLNAITRCACATNQQINAIVCNPEYDEEFVYYLICFNKNKLLQLAGQTAVPIVSKNQFEDMELYVPPTFEEQNRIGEILAAIDLEIESLEKELRKYRQLKQGMMQQLLTGKIRLK